MCQHEYAEVAPCMSYNVQYNLSVLLYTPRGSLIYRPGSTLASIIGGLCMFFYVVCMFGFYTQGFTNCECDSPVPVDQPVHTCPCLCICPCVCHVCPLYVMCIFPDHIDYMCMYIIIVTNCIFVFVCIIETSCFAIIIIKTWRERLK
jgi:hypothetical protein